MFWDAHNCCLSLHGAVVVVLAVVLEVFGMLKRYIDAAGYIDAADNESSSLYRELCVRRSF